MTAKDIVDEMKRQAIREAAANAVRQLRRWLDLVPAYPAKVENDPEGETRSFRGLLVCRDRHDELLRVPWGKEYSPLESAYIDEMWAYDGRQRLPELSGGEPAFEAMLKFQSLVPSQLMMILPCGHGDFPSPLAELWFDLIHVSELDHHPEGAGSRKLNVDEIVKYRTARQLKVDAVVPLILRLEELSLVAVGGKYGPAVITAQDIKLWVSREVSTVQKWIKSVGWEPVTPSSGSRPAEYRYGQSARDDLKSKWTADYPEPLPGL